MAEDLSSLFDVFRKKAGLAEPPKGGPAHAAQVEQKTTQEQELMSYLKTRLDEVEKKLIDTQEKALDATIKLQERELAQRQAQGEMEQVLKSVQATRRIQEADQKQDEELLRAQARIWELEHTLLKSIPKDVGDKLSEIQERVEQVEESVGRMDGWRKNFLKGARRSMLRMMGWMRAYGRWLEGERKSYREHSSHLSETVTRGVDRHMREYEEDPLSPMHQDVLELQRRVLAIEKKLSYRE